MYEVQTLVPRLRRLIGDTEDFKQYSDSILEEYIIDSVYNILIIWEHEYEIEEEVITENEEEVTIYYFNEEPSELEKTFFLIQAKIDMLSKSRNVSFRSGSLSVTHKGDDKQNLEDKLIKAIKNKKVLEGKLGNVSTEYDTFENRLESWINKLLL